MTDTEAGSSSSSDFTVDPMAEDNARPADLTGVRKPSGKEYTSVNDTKPRPAMAEDNLRESFLSRATKISSFEDTPGGRSTAQLADDEIVLTFTIRLDKLLEMVNAYTTNKIIEELESLTRIYDGQIKASVMLDLNDRIAELRKTL